MTNFYRTVNDDKLLSIKDHRKSIYISLRTINDINLYLDTKYTDISSGTQVHGSSPISLSTKKRILSRYPRPFNKIAYFMHFMRRRVLTKPGRSSAQLHDMHYSEILGRIASKGFSISDFSIENDVLIFSATKTPAKIITLVSQGIIFKMPRVGKNGKTINVYKIRTMHAYAEYLQDFILAKNGLDSDGKFRNDFRIANWGKFLRRYWIDELPMIINLFKGDIKLVGVRPISAKYLKLYPDDVKELRLKAKPGLIPPSYADSASSLDDIVRLEKIYLLKQIHRPFITDIQYLAKIICNLFVRKIRSK